MLLQLFIVSFFAVITLSSCDPAISVVITNKSKADKQIRVYCPPEAVSSPCGCNSNRDSMAVYLDEKKDNRFPFFIPTMMKDTAARMYAFVLKAGYTAAIEPIHMGSWPCYGKQFIIDNADTIELKRHGKDFVRKPCWSLGGAWTYTIQDK